MYIYIYICVYIYTYIYIYMMLDARYSCADIRVCQLPMSGTSKSRHTLIRMSHTNEPWHT